MSTGDSIPRPSDPQYIALVKCATKRNRVGDNEYSVFILTHANPLLNQNLCNNTRNTYKTGQDCNQLERGLGKRKKKVCSFVIRSHDLRIRSTLLYRMRHYLALAWAFDVWCLYTLGIIRGIHRECGHTPSARKAWFDNSCVCYALRVAVAAFPALRWLPTLCAPLWGP